MQMYTWKKHRYKLLTCQLSGQIQWKASSRFRQVPAFWHGLLLHVFFCTVCKTQDIIKAILNRKDWDVSLITWAIFWNGWSQQYLFYGLNLWLECSDSGVQLIQLVCDVWRRAAVFNGVDVSFVDFDLEKKDIHLHISFIKTHARTSDVCWLFH